MFCPIMSIEMKVETCPAKQCMYKGIGGSCCYAQLTDEAVTVFDIADARQDKVYKIKSAAASGKQAITVGIQIGKYADFIRDSFPTQSVQTVNKGQDTHVSRVLENTFKLHPNQHQHFWNTERFESWKSRLGLSLSMKEIRQALLAASVM